jgi:hypothetical protein
MWPEVFLKKDRAKNNHFLCRGHLQNVFLRTIVIKMIENLSKS